MIHFSHRLTMTEITKQKLSAANFCHTWHEICQVCEINRSAHRTKQERTEKRKKSLVTFLFSLNLRPQLKTVWSLRRTFITSLYFISGLTKHRPRWEPNLNFHNGGHGVFLILGNLFWVFFSHNIHLISQRSTSCPYCRFCLAVIWL